MSVDSFKTQDAWFCAAMQYVFTEEALVRIERQENDFGRDTPTFHFAIPSLDAGEYQREFQAGAFAIADLKSFIRTYSFLTRRLRDMKKRGEKRWVSDRWVRGEVN